VIENSAMTELLSRDQAFIEKLSGIVLTNLQNQNFGVNELAQKAGLSRSVIHRRLRSIKDQNITQFIREIRLKRAMELLQQHSGPASDVAYIVGFGSPAYFNKCFHEYYGYPPGEVKLRNLPEDQDASEPEHMHARVKEAPVNRKKVNRKVPLIMAAVVMAILTITIIFFNGTHRDSKYLSIVVLPFKNLSNDTENQYIADGLMEDILNNLYHISKLSVKSRTTSEHYRGTTLTSREIAHEIKVRNVLEGSIRRQDNKMRFSIQLIDARRDKHLWSANYDRGLNDILGIQGEIALQVANKLNAVISDNEAKQISELPTKNSEAYNYYLKGRFLLHRSINEQRTDIDKEGLMGSLQYFEKAIAADANFTEAYAGMAQAWFDLSAWGFLPTKEGFLKAKELSLKAIEIDPDCAEAHTAKGAFHAWGDRNFEEARKEFLTALQLKPNYPVVHQYYAQLLMITGPIEEARTFMNSALELEPYFWVLHNLNAYIYYFEGKHREAIQSCQIARDMKQNYILNNWLFFLNYTKLGEGEKAVKELQEILRTATDTVNYADEIPEVYRKSGIEGLFIWMIDININRPAPVFGLSGEPFPISWWYAILGDKEKSIYWLEKNMEQKLKRHAFFDLIATNPDFDILRDDPRFIAIIQKIGLTKYNIRKAR
jgi:TolB-like protein/AraC-like DNA-binding protein/Tfp pilus assembly protein PilF